MTVKNVQTLYIPHPASITMVYLPRSRSPIDTLVLTIIVLDVKLADMNHRRSFQMDCVQSVDLTGQHTYSVSQVTWSVR